MEVLKTNLQDCFLIEPKVFKDARGYFFETFNQQKFNEAIGQNIQFVQDNESMSSKGVLRGLHYQKGEFSQAKLVRVVKGSVLDVVVDIRQHSPTFGKHYSVVLSEDNKKQLFIPKGFAHGFLVLEDHTIFSYKCDNLYHKPSERGIIYNDPTLNIDWGINTDVLILSDKDQLLPNFEDAELC
jgi:dTDP-4-dehydrorhamnose 3,5-epimerase